MHGDFSRFSLEPDAPWTWTRVLFQQGRLPLDADFNAQAAIFLALYRQLARDLIGEHGGPKDKLGFEITRGTDNRLTIGEGHYWVAGWPIENEDKLFLDDQPSF